MSGRKIAGVDVKVSVGTGSTKKVIGGQSGATLDRSTNIIEVTSKDANGWAESVGGVKSWSIECEGFIVVDDASLDELENIWYTNGTVEVEINVRGKQYTGEAIIESFPLEFPGDDAVSFSLSLTGTGELKMVKSVPEA